MYSRKKLDVTWRQLIVSYFYQKRIQIFKYIKSVFKWWKTSDYILSLCYLPISLHPSDIVVYVSYWKSRGEFSSRIHFWMNSNKLFLNPSKAKFLLINTKQLKFSHLTTLSFGNDVIPGSSSARNSGIAKKFGAQGKQWWSENFDTQSPFLIHFGTPLAPWPPATGGLPPPAPSLRHWLV